eukprot:m.493506 g.493506  ORF g.493506 m.493506 type:complete len:77 (-) comp119570_c0_seq1:179-409(-)
MSDRINVRKAPHPRVPLWDGCVKCATFGLTLRCADGDIWLCVSVQIRVCELFVKNEIQSELRNPRSIPVRIYSSEC